MRNPARAREPSADARYYLRRAEQELKMAEASSMPAVTRAHYELAQAHFSLAERTQATGTPPEDRA